LVPGPDDANPAVVPVPNAQLKIYPDSAHGFLFQHHKEFAGDVETFLDG